MGQELDSCIPDVVVAWSKWKCTEAEGGETVELGKGQIVTSLIADFVEGFVMKEVHRSS